MSRKTINSPLAGAAPTLQPAARPITIPIGATPPAKFSGLMELANAFRDFNPELRDMLRDTAAREDADAMALGELEAAKANTSQNMAKIETVLKEKVDAGELPRVRFPAFQRGFRLRVGKDLAQTALQNDLTAGLEAAIKGGPEAAEKIASEAYTKHAEKLASSDLYAREGYQSVASGLLASFRQQASAGYAAEYQKQAEQAVADEGSELAYQLATADADTLPTVRASMLTQLDEIRREIPKSETNGFYVERVLAPAVAKLTNARNFSAARQLLDEAEGLDVTGSGGKLGQTAVAKSKFAELRTRIERESRAETFEEVERVRAENALQTLQGHNEAGAQLQKLRLDSKGTLPPAKRFELVDAFRAAHPNQPTLVQGFAEAVQHEYENEEKWRADERATSDLFVKLNTVSKAKLDEAENTVEALYSSGALAPTARTQARDIIAKRRALFGAIDDGDFRAMKSELFRLATDALGNVTTKPNFGEDAANDAWTGLAATAQDSVQADAAAFFSAQFERAIELDSGGDATKVPLVKAAAYEKALGKTREHVRALVVDATKSAQAETHAANVQKHAATIQHAKAVVIPSRSLWSQLMGRTNAPPHSYEVQPEPKAKGLRPPASETRSFVPSVGTDYAERAKAQEAEPVAEWDVMPTPSHFTSTRSLQRIADVPPVLDLRELAKEALADGTKADTATGNPQRAKIAARFYGIAKSSLGFTPDEIVAGKTKHGVAFTAGEIDWRTITVFRSVVELEKEWNKGDFSELFGKIGDAVDPKHTMYPEDFYKAQLALLSQR